MLHQCAWCLCMLNGEGGRLSSSPQPKLYQASHGICNVCGAKWIEQAVALLSAQEISLNSPTSIPNMELFPPRTRH